MAEISLRVPTAFCPHCQYTIEQAVGNLRGVIDVVVDLPCQIVTVRYDPAEVSPEDIRQRVEGAGFPVAG